MFRNKLILHISLVLPRNGQRKGVGSSSIHFSLKQPIPLLSIHMIFQAVNSLFAWSSACYFLPVDISGCDLYEHFQHRGFISSKQTCTFSCHWKAYYVKSREKQFSNIFYFSLEYYLYTMQHQIISYVITVILLCLLLHCVCFS